MFLKIVTLAEGVSAGLFLAVFQSYEQTLFPYQNFQRGIILFKIQVELRYLFSAHRLIVLYICINFPESTSMGFRVIERTRFVMDRRTDIHTDRQLWERLYVSSIIMGGEIIIQIN